MKSLKAFATALAIIISASLPLYAKDSKQLTPADNILLQEAIDLGEVQRYDEALKIFEKLCKEHPDNYIINYETLLIYYQMQNYKEVLQQGKKLMKFKDADALIYQLCGNCQSILGKKKEAIETYKQGLKRFPEAGMLYLEIGNVFMMNNQNEEALYWYNEGIRMDPDFSSNYFRAAEQYFDSNFPIWGLIYAETEILLNPNNSQRFQIMSEKMAECFESRIKITEDTLSVKLAATRNINILKSDNDPQVILDFAGVYEGCLGVSLFNIWKNKTMNINSVSALSALRLDALNAYYDICHNLYGNRMYLLEYQKKVADAGHWEAYNRYIFLPVFQEEIAEWLEDNEEKLDAFIQWYNSGNQFRLNNERTVGVTTVNSGMKPLNMMEALSIQAKLLTPKISDYKENNKTSDTVN